MQNNNFNNPFFSKNLYDISSKRSINKTDRFDTKSQGSVNRMNAFEYGNRIASQNLSKGSIIPGQPITNGSVIPGHYMNQEMNSKGSIGSNYFYENLYDDERNYLEEYIDDFKNGVISFNYLYP